MGTLAQKETYSYLLLRALRAACVVISPLQPSSPPCTFPVSQNMVIGSGPLLNEGVGKGGVLPQRSGWKHSSLSIG